MLLRIAVALVLLCSCAPKPLPPVVVESPEDLTVEVLQRWMREILPLIEQAAGREFVNEPFVRVSTPAEMDRVVREEVLMIMSLQYPDVSKNEISGRLPANLSGGIAGKYGIFTEVMYVDLPSIFAMGRRGGSSIEVASKLLLAHELTHALQGQVAGVGEAFANVSSVDEMEALRALTEGHAEFVTRAVGEAMGAADAARAMDEAQGWTDESGPSMEAVFPIWFAYGQGRVYMDGLYERGGTEAQWAALEEPILQTAPIFGQAPREALDDADLVPLKAIVEGLERRLGDGKWFALGSPVGELTLRQGFYVANRDPLAAFSAVRGGWTRSAELRDREVGLSVLLFDDAAAARQFVEWVPQASNVVSSRALELGDSGMHVVRQPTFNGATMTGVDTETSIYAVARGSRVALLHCSRFRPGLRAQEVLTAMLERMESP